MLKTVFLLLFLFAIVTPGFSQLFDTFKVFPVLHFPEPYNKVIKPHTVSDTGLFIIHIVQNRYLFEIKDSLFNKDLLVVNRISKAPADSRNPRFAMGYAGDQIGSSVIRFVKGPDYKIYIKKMSYSDYSIDSSENGLYKSVVNSNLQPIVAAFDIKTITPDSSAIIIDMTDYLNSDNDVFVFSLQQSKEIFSLAAYQSDKSYIEGIHTFPLNTEIKAIKTYLTPLAKVATKTFEINSSIVLLPNVPMKPRFSDTRVGFFYTSNLNFDANPQKVERTFFTVRWRLEPKDCDVQKYLNGELVEPKNPIVFYIDPTTPKKWIPYLIQGVNDWQKAFEQAGFKSAIYAMEAPKNDPSWSLEDARHNAIVYKPADIENASGPNVHDPRTGEILEAHVNWYHNVMQLIHDWYMIQASAIDPKARKMEFEDSLMGQLIRFVSSHEIGHTLGLMHNFGSSSTVPVDSLRNKKWVETNGICPSIMDYARFNYVAQPEDNISETGIFPRIGVYDKWAIEWGYKWLPQFSTPEAEKSFLNQWVINKLSTNNKLWFGSEFSLNDPRCQAEDLGDNPMVAGYYGIKNLKRILPRLASWTYVPNELDNTSYRNLANQVFEQYKRYLMHAAKLIGGVYVNRKSAEQGTPVLGFVPKVRQREAINFLSNEIFKTPTWLFDTSLFFQAGQNALINISLIQKEIIDKITSEPVLLSILANHSIQGSNSYSLEELLSDLTSDIFLELKDNENIGDQRRNMQKIFAQRLIRLLSPDLDAELMDKNEGEFRLCTDVPTISREAINNLLTILDQAIPGYKYRIEKYHLEDLRYRLQASLKGNNNKNP